MSHRPRPTAKIGRRARLRIGDDGPQHAAEAFGPGDCVVPFGDQVLPDLDQRIGQSTRSGDLVDRVAGQGAVVGLVVADLISAKIPFRDQRFDQRFRDAPVAIPQIPIFQGRASERMTGVNE